MSVSRLVPVLVAFAGSMMAFAQNSVDDPDFDSHIKNPAYTHSHPRVMFDRGHLNLSTAVGQSIDKNSAKLLEADGYNVSKSDGRFEAAKLRGLGILVIAVPFGGSTEATASNMHSLRKRWRS